MSEWQPIETAPFYTGGTPHVPQRQCDEVLAWDGNEVFVATFRDDIWRNLCNVWEPARPTHWQALPAPPI